MKVLELFNNPLIPNRCVDCNGAVEYGPPMKPVDYVYSSEDLTTLRSALERVCQCMGLDREGEEAELVGSNLLLLFWSGATDVDQLISAFVQLGDGSD